MVFSGPVAEASAKPDDAQAAKGHDLVVDTVAALRRTGAVALVMISVDIEQGRVAHGHKKGEIIRLQIAAGQDQIDVVQLFLAEIVPIRFVFFVGKTQYFHRGASCSGGI